MKKLWIIVLILAVLGILIWTACHLIQVAKPPIFVGTKRPVNKILLSQEECGKYMEAIAHLGRYYVRDRKQAADLFDELVTKCPDSHYVQHYQETADILRKMAEEDKSWQEPAEVSKLSLDEQISYYIYKLRDAPCDCFIARHYSVLGTRPCDPVDPAVKLRQIGKPAIPALINLLNDRRIIRWVPTTGIMWLEEDAEGKKGYCSLDRDFFRYQDATIEILEEVFPPKSFCEIDLFSYDYFSTLKPEIRQKIIEDIKSWWQKTRGK